MRELSHLLRANVRVKRDSKNQEMIYPWNGASSGSAVMDESLYRSRRQVLSIFRDRSPRSVTEATLQISG